MLLKLADPSVILARPDEYILAPTESYERHGRVPNVLFSCGHIVEPDATVKLYYAGADTCICLATFNAEEMAEACLKKNDYPLGYKHGVSGSFNRGEKLPYSQRASTSRNRSGVTGFVM